MMNTSYMKVYSDILALPEITQESYDEIIKNYRVQRVENKAVENSTKKALNSPDVLDVSDFIFEPFEQERGEGDSGNLLLATHKDDASRKYIVKHAFCDCAANEFVYSKIAGALGLKMPDIKLFRLSDPLDDMIFKTEYIIGIEYLNIVDQRPNAETLRKAKNADDYYKFHTLYKLFFESDSFEVVLADDGYIYRIDTGASFLIENSAMLTAGFDKIPDEYRIYARVLTNKWTWDSIDKEMKFLTELCGEDKISLLLEPLYEIQKIYKPYISKFLDTLCYFYPDCIGDYYSFFFSTLKKRVKSFTAAIERYQPSPYF